MESQCAADRILRWRPAALDDVARISIIESQAHRLEPERPEVFEEKLRLFGAGCMVLTRDGTIVGYGVAHPWLLDDVPALNSFLGALPSEPQCIFIHDVALLPEARACGAGRAFVQHVSRIAAAMRLPNLALVSVYDTHHLWGRYGFEIRETEAIRGKMGQYGSTARYMVATLG